MPTTSVTEQELDNSYAFAVQLGKNAGKLLLDIAQSRCKGEETQEAAEKDSSVDIVTKADEGQPGACKQRPVAFRMLIYMHICE